MPRLKEALDGHFYTQAFVGPGSPPATFQITYRGYSFLQERGVDVGDDIPKIYFETLKLNGWAYTGGSGIDGFSPYENQELLDLNNLPESMQKDVKTILKTSNSSISKITHSKTASGAQKWEVTFNNSSPNDLPILSKASKLESPSTKEPRPDIPWTTTSRVVKPASSKSRRLTSSTTSSEQLNPSTKQSESSSVQPEQFKPLASAQTPIKSQSETKLPQNPPSLEVNSNRTIGNSPSFHASDNWRSTQEETRKVKKKEINYIQLFFILVICILITLIVLSNSPKNVAAVGIMIFIAVVIIGAAKK